ncbi:WD domain-containing protein [Phlyctema vagabunda]|uniref:WD domain-containing protein n=1 Tax=Phlyctema vagabunda TaxID=108571 RepID=A0ABR4P8G3_9HELO
MLRNESAHLDKDGKPVAERAEDFGTQKYDKGFRLLSSWIDQNLDIYKFELKRLLWPIFVYSYLELVAHGFATEAGIFIREHKAEFEAVHSDEIRTFETVTLAQHVDNNSTTKLYRENKYRLPLNSHVYYNLITHLETNAKAGGTVIIYLLQTFCDVRETTRGPIDQYSFEAIINQARSAGPDNQDQDLQEGIPGAFTGVTNKDLLDNSLPLKLGMMPMEAELEQDVRAELEDEDAKHPPEFGKPSLIEEFDNIKREESVEPLSRNEIPLPPSRARDVVMEVQKVKENRDRFKIESRTGGIGPAVSVCMFTFHNTLDTITCIEFSDDNNLVAVGTEESYIRVWHLHGDALPSVVPANGVEQAPASSRRLIGHSAPVYSVSFSPSIEGPETVDRSTPSTAPKLLLSSSSDKTVRLWSLEAWTCLVVYKGHEGPVWNVRWGPFGHYFATCGWDKTVRVWGQDHISYLRLMVGHDSNVNQIAWHPNGAYIFSASDEADKTVRMWSFVTGTCVRIFTGHQGFISAIECAPNGKILASADGEGQIILWDLNKGTMIKRCRGHGKGGIWSLSFSVESTVLTSGGADGTVRIWDIEVPADPHKNVDGEVIGAGGQADATRINGATAVSQTGTGSGVAVGGKKKGKDTMITPDQISAFPTKKSPVYQVKFTRMNLVLAGGCYLP